ncbi:RHOMBOID-like protein 12, mitochondrial [Prunus avium]|uniref:RHOMBOID-like protein 12, mitochondrial n=1 Tax=Prunus avium TaxID=42229 RepID=A0A6P5S8X9_PRUAV|nr:RHOMBOID-like protein 12, mitochondrial [Prunus avium]XP_021809957.1 RHOMBOID-like protein 12, mitochondrial [Prunus avium]
MQRLLSLKLASNLPKNLPNSSTTSSLFHFQPHKTLSLTKPPQTQPQGYFFSSFPAHPIHHLPHSWRFQHTLTQKIHGFLSNPLLKWHFFFGFPNTLMRVSSKSLSSEFKPAGFFRAQFRKHILKFNPNQSPSWRSWFRRVSEGEVVLGLIIANVAVFMLWKIADVSFMAKNFTISLDNFTSGRLHTLITCAFSHIDAGHVTSNMLGLYVFGKHIGRIFGPEFFLKLYLAGAVGGSVFFLVHKAYLAASSKGGQPMKMDPSKIQGLGASGAVTAIMLLDIFLFPKSTIYLEFIVPVPAILMGIYIIGKDLTRIIRGDQRISGSAHLGGAAVAAIAWARIRKGRF